MENEGGTGVVRVREAVEQRKERAVERDTDPIDALLVSDDNDTVSRERDDIFEKAVASSAGEFRKAFHGRANSHKGVSWEFKKKNARAK